jgi:hypothetical protein
LHLMEGITNVYGIDNIKNLSYFWEFLFQFHYSLIFINTLVWILWKKDAATTYCFTLPARKPHMFVKLSSLQFPVPWKMYWKAVA